MAGDEWCVPLEKSFRLDVKIVKLTPLDLTLKDAGIVLSVKTIPY